MPYRLLVALLSCAAASMAQNPELGEIRVRNLTATLEVNGPRPIDMAAKTLAVKYGLRINVEDPGPGHPVTAGRLTVTFRLTDQLAPASPSQLVADIVKTANAALPIKYRLQSDADWYSIIPTHVRGAPVTPLLDRLVTIPAGTRPIAASANLMAEELARQSGARVHCCQPFVAGIPWGLEPAEFSAKNEPARSVLKRLIGAGKQHWLLRCDASSPAWCFINLPHRQLYSHYAFPALPRPLPPRPTRNLLPHLLP
ncbi:MAG: hypothetical protein JNM66_12740 [Bryobacterales bacterium]|nr:hypothetical protein [Bryobacterales bacterium]